MPTDCEPWPGKRKANFVIDDYRKSVRATADLREGMRIKAKLGGDEAKSAQSVQIGA